MRQGWAAGPDGRTVLYVKNQLEENAPHTITAVLAMAKAES